MAIKSLMDQPSTIISESFLLGLGKRERERSQEIGAAVASPSVGLWSTAPMESDIVVLQGRQLVYFGRAPRTRIAANVLDSK